MDLVPLKVTLRPNAKVNPKDPGILYPDFNRIPSTARQGFRWQQFVDLNGGPIYDKASGFGEQDPGSPDPMEWHVCYVVPEPFAREAATLFPNDVEVLTESELQTYYDSRSIAHLLPPEKIDSTVIDALRSKYGVPTGRLTADGSWDQADRESIDPTNPRAGIVKDPRASFTGFKTSKGFTIQVADVTRVLNARTAALGS